MTTPERRVPTARRMYLIERHQAWDAGLAGVWRSKQEGQPGTALPLTFPFRDVLVRGGYSTAEDLDGADEEELVTNTTLSTLQSTAVLKAFASL